MTAVRKFFINGLVVAGTIGLASCAKQYVSIEAIEYNKALAKNMVEEILLNSARASKRRPMSFSAIGGLQGNIGRSANLDLTLPVIDKHSVDGYTARPSLKGNYNNTASFSNLNQSDFYNKIRKEINPETYLYFSDNGWARDVLDMIVIQKMDVTDQLLDYIWFKAYKKAKGRRGAVAALDSNLQQLMALNQQGYEGCSKAINRISNARREATNERLKLREFMFQQKSSSKRFTVENRPRQPCSYVEFQNLVMAMGLANVELVREPTKSGWKKTKRKTVSHNGIKKEILEEDYKSASSKIVLKLNEKNMHGPLPEDYAKLHFRSPEAMILFLGDIIAAKNYMGFDPRIRTGIGYQQTELFNVVTGYLAGSPVNITDDDGQMYSIVKPVYGAANEDRSLHALTLVSQLIALQTQADTFTQPQSVTLITSN